MFNLRIFGGRDPRPRLRRRRQRPKVVIRPFAVLLGLPLFTRFARNAVNRGTVGPWRGAVVMAAGMGAWN